MATKATEVPELSPVDAYQLAEALYDRLASGYTKTQFIDGVARLMLGIGVTSAASPNEAKPRPSKINDALERIASEYPPRSSEALPCAECGAPDAPYAEHRCMLHYGGQTKMVPRADKAPLTGKQLAEKYGFKPHGDEPWRSWVGEALNRLRSGDEPDSAIPLLRQALEEACSETAEVDELAPLRAMMAKGREKYPNGCTVTSLSDETGEVVHAVNKYEPEERVREEILDVASVAMRLYLGEIDRGLTIDGLVQRRTDGECRGEARPITKGTDR